MSRQNKVNPGMYTQRGRLTQDDAARELRKQREVGSQHTWQPVERDQSPSFESNDENADEVTETSGDTSAVDTKPAAGTGQPFRQLINKPKPKARAKAAKTAARKAAAKKATTATKRGKAKTAKAAKPKAKAAKRRKS